MEILPLYRNVENDLTGRMTHEQAAVFPELLEFVDESEGEPVPELPTTPVITDPTDSDPEGE